MQPDSIQRQRERVQDAWVAYQFACHYTKEMYAERAQPDGKARYVAALAIRHQRLAEYRHQMRLLEDMERKRHRWNSGTA